MRVTFTFHRHRFAFRQLFMVDWGETILVSASTVATIKCWSFFRARGVKSFVEMETEICELQLDDNFIAQLNYPSHLIRFLPLLIYQVDKHSLNASSHRILPLEPSRKEENPPKNTLWFIAQADRFLSFQGRRKKINWISFLIQFLIRFFGSQIQFFG